ncbi:MAG: hypothetical protein ACK5FE_15985 [Cyanobacteriota bacterium]
MAHSVPLPSRLPLRSLLGVGLALGLAAMPAAPGWSASPLLESVKQNPALAKSLCARFKGLNAQGISATSRSSIDVVAKEQGLSQVDAEVLATYVIGLHCPDVR